MISLYDILNGPYSRIGQIKIDLSSPKYIPKRSQKIKNKQRRRQNARKGKCR